MNAEVQFLKNVLDEAPIAMVHIEMIFDRYGMPCDCVVLDMNATCADFYNISKNESVGKRMSEVFPPCQEDSESFDWLSCYAHLVASTEKNSEVTWFSNYAHKRFRIKALPLPVKGEFVVYLVETQENLTKAEQAETVTESFNKSASGDRSIKKIPAWKGCEDYMLNPSDVYYLSINVGEIEIHTKKDTFFVRGTLKEWEKKLSSLDFFRSHKCFIVNMAKIERLVLCVDNSYKIRMEGIADDIPLSRNKVLELKNHLII